MTEIRDAYARVIHDAKEGLIHEHERNAMINALITTHPKNDSQVNEIPGYPAEHLFGESIWPARWDRRAVERERGQRDE